MGGTLKRSFRAFAAGKIAKAGSSRKRKKWSRTEKGKTKRKTGGGHGSFPEDSFIIREQQTTVDQCIFTQDAIRHDGDQSAQAGCQVKITRDHGQGCDMGTRQCGIQAGIQAPALQQDVQRQKPETHSENAPQPVPSPAALSPPSCFDLLCDGLTSNILNRVPLYQKLFSVPRVCPRWWSLSHDSVCWETINLDDQMMSGCSKKLFDFLPRTERCIQRLIDILVPRSSGALKEFKLTFNGFLIDDTLQLIAHRGHSLKTLHIVGARLTDACACDVAPKLPSITDLNIMRCYPLSGVGLAAFGQHCKSLHHLYVSLSTEKCFAIAECLPQLSHLHARYVYRPSRVAIQAIINKCINLKAFIFEAPSHEPRMSRTFLNECMRQRCCTTQMFYGCVCCRGYIWASEHDCFLETQRASFATCMS